MQCHQPCSRAQLNATSRWLSKCPGGPFLKAWGTAVQARLSSWLASTEVGAQLTRGVNAAVLTVTTTGKCTSAHIGMLTCME